MGRSRNASDKDSRVSTAHLVVLVHGFFKGAADMSRLAEHLTKAGYRVCVVDLPTTFGDFSQCVAALARQIDAKVRQAHRISFVAHSLGGLIVRAYWHQVTPTKLAHCVFIATPHGGTRLAEIADALPGYGRVFKPIKVLRPNLDYADKPTDSFHLGLIAGTRNQGLGRWWLSSLSDGRVEVRDVASADASAMLTLPYSHKAIHKQVSCLEAVTYFLQHGQFERA